MNIRMQWWILWICILLKVEHRKWMTYLNWEYVTFLSFKFEFNAITNVVTQPNLPLCSISSSFKGLETSCWSFEKGTLSHSCLIVPGCLCHIFFVSWCFNWFQLVKGLVCRQTPSTQVLVLRSRAIKPIDGIRGLALSFWNTQDLPWTRCLGTCDALKPVYTFQYWWRLPRFTNCQLHMYYTCNK